MNFKNYLFESEVKLNNEFVNEFRKEYLRVLRSIENFLEQDRGRTLTQIKQQLRKFAFWLEDYVANSILRDTIQKISIGGEVDPLKQRDKDEMYELIYSMREKIIDLAEDFGGSRRDAYREWARKKIERVRHYGRKLVNKMEEWIELYIDGKISVGRKFTYKNFTVIPGNPEWGRGQGSRDISPTDKRMEEVYEMLTKVHAVLSKSEFSKVVEEPIDIFVTPRGKGLEAAHYHRGDDYILIRGLADVGGIVHEFGHRHFYRVMSPRDRDAWENFYEGDKYVISKDDIGLALNYVKMELEEMEWGEVQNYWIRKDGDSEYPESYSVRDIVELALTKAVGAGTFPDRVKDEMIDWIPVVDTKYDSKDKIMDMLQDTWKSNLEGNQIMQTKISGYGDKSATEAYPEAFRRYVMGEGLDEKVEYMFRRVSGVD